VNKRERVIAAIGHVRTDRVPYHLRFTAKERDKFVAYTGIQDPESHFGNHIDLASCMDFATEIGKGRFRDEFGVVWDRRDGSDIGLPEGVILKEPVLGAFAPPEPVSGAIAAQMARLTRGEWDSFRAVNVGFTLYERAWSLRGIENLLMDMLQEEDFVAELFDRITEYDLLAMDRARSCSDDFDAFFLGDDWGQQTGLIMSRELWKKLIGPRILALIEHGKKGGKYTRLFQISLLSLGEYGQLQPCQGLGQRRIDDFPQFGLKMVSIQNSGQTAPTNPIAQNKTYVASAAGNTKY
jgi:uroporphyrinogen decarboxylase